MSNPQLSDLLNKKKCIFISGGTNSKNPNFEHPNFGISELRTPRTYLKKYKSNSNFKGWTSNFYKDKKIMILRHFKRKKNLFFGRQFKDTFALNFASFSRAGLFRMASDFSPFPLLETCSFFLIWYFMIKKSMLVVGLIKKDSNIILICPKPNYHFFWLCNTKLEKRTCF